MKKTVFAVIAAASLTFLNAVDVQSQQSKFFTSIISGMSAPVRFGSSPYNSGISVGLRGGYINSSHLATGLSLTYNAYSTRYQGNITGGDLHVVQYRGFMILKNFASRSNILPYGVVSVGIDVTGTSDLNIGSLYTVDEKTDWGPAVDLGAGLLYKASNKIEIFLEPQLGIPMTNNSNGIYLNLKGGLNFQL